MRLLVGLLALASLGRADFVYTLIENSSSVPGQLPMGIAQFSFLTTLPAPVLPFPPPATRSYPPTGAFYVPAASDMICGGTYYTCTQPSDGTYWWDWPRVGVEALFVGENQAQQTAEFLADFGQIDLSQPGAYFDPNASGLKLVIEDPPSATVAVTPEPAAVLFSGLGLIVIGALHRAKRKP